MYGTQKMNLGAVHPNMMVQVGSTVKAASNTTDEPVVVTLEPTMTGYGNRD